MEPAGEKMDVKIRVREWVRRANQERGIYPQHREDGGRGARRGGHGDGDAEICVYCLAEKRVGVGSVVGLVTVEVEADLKADVEDIDLRHQASNILGEYGFTARDTVDIGTIEAVGEFLKQRKEAA